MTVLPYAVAAWLFLVGLYGVVTSRNLVHTVMCLAVTQSSTYVLLLAIGYRSSSTAPVYVSAKTNRFADPVVAALTLTDIVVGVTVTAVLLVLCVQIHKKFGTLNPDAIDALQG